MNQIVTKSSAGMLAVLSKLKSANEKNLMEAILALNVIQELAPNHINELDPENLGDTTPSVKQHIQETMLHLAHRIWNLCGSTDDSRFSVYDFADALSNWNRPYSLTKLLALSDDDFELALLQMAETKRHIYSDGITHDNDAADRILADIQTV